MIKEQSDNILNYDESNLVILYVKLRECTRELSKVMDEICPESKEKSLAFTHLHELEMWANASFT